MLLRLALKLPITTEMEIGVDNISLIFQNAGFLKTKHNIYLKEVKKGELSEWSVSTFDSDKVLVSLGAVSPSINKFAFNLLKKSTQGRIKPQFPAYAGPPILVLQEEYINIENVEDELPLFVNCFENMTRKYSIDDWFHKAEEIIPYGPSQSIILPAYYYIKKNKSALLSYLDKIHFANPARDLGGYFCALERMASEL